jgi:hypothetical protein
MAVIDVVIAADVACDEQAAAFEQAALVLKYGILSTGCGRPIVVVD